MWLNADVQIGARLGPYEIVSPLGAGGMGEVYRAKDSRLKRDVAVKILPVELVGDTERQKRFHREAEAISSLNHPNILSVYDVGTENGTPYIVSELIEGESLRKLLQKGALPIRKLLDIGVQIADGLAAAHQAGIVHRDLKPENIMITPAGRAKILDFGLAKPVLPQTGGTDEETASAALTESGIILGTVRYMSPEQASGLPTDFRSDQFSFGLLLYEMATGKQAFVRNTPVQTLSAIVGDDPAPIVTLNPKVPPPLRWLIERTLAKDPTHRYGATIDLYHELRNLRDHLSEATSTGTMAPVSTSKWTVKSVLMAALLFLLPVITFVIAALFLPSTGADLSSYRLIPLTTDTGSEEMPSWSPDGKTVAYSARVNGIPQVFSRSLDSPTSAQITRREEDGHDPFWSPDGNGIFFYSASSLWKVSAAGGSPEVIMKDLVDATISPDGKTLVFLREIGGTATLWISSPPGSEPKRLPPSFFDMNRFHNGLLYFSPDGSKIGMLLYPTDQTGAQIECWIVPFPSGKARRILEKSTDPLPLAGISWMSDSRHMIFAGRHQKDGTSSLWMTDSESGTTERITVGSRNEDDPSVSPVGNKIVFSISDTNYDIVEIPLDGSPMRNVLATSRDEFDPAWSPSGTQYAYATNRSGTPEIWIKSIEGWDRPIITQANFGEDVTSILGRPKFSPDGQRIAYFRQGQKNKYAIWISTVAGGPPVLVTGGPGEYSWSPDGEWISFNEGSPEGFRVSKVRVGTGQKIGLTKKVPILQGLLTSWSPSGEWIAYHTAEGLAIVSSDGKVNRLMNESNPIVAGWSRDGQTLYGVWARPTHNLILSAIDIESGNEKTILDLGSSIPHMRGFSLAVDGKSFVTSVQRSEADLWILEGFQKPRGLFSFFSRN